MECLYFSLIIVMILNSNDMSESLIIWSESILVNPLAIIWTQSVKVYPQSSWFVSDDSLRSVCVNGYFIFIILNVGKCSHWVWISINVIKLSLIEMSLIILMVEKLSFHYQPSIWISVEFLLIFYFCLNLQIKIL